MFGPKPKKEKNKEGNQQIEEEKKGSKLFCVTWSLAPLSHPWKKKNLSTNEGKGQK